MNSQNAGKRELFRNKLISYNLPDAKIQYFPDFFSHATSDQMIRNLIQNIEWRQNTIEFYGKRSLVPRLEAWYGDTGKSYSYSGIRMDPIPWTEELLEIKLAVEKSTKLPFNSVLVNYYRDGNDRVAWHSDDEKELGRNPVIGSISFGAERKFKLRHKDYKKNGYKAEIKLENGSLLLMKGETQHHWMHEIPRSSHPIGPRVNLTFRFIR
jgi:alkylated DNA repair dioxygenase AlkB